MELVEMQKDVQITMPVKTLESLKSEFGISDIEVKSFLAALIDKAIKERSEMDDSQVFTEAECLEMEEDLKGLGYI
jgi:hypothetical protein